MLFCFGLIDWFTAVASIGTLLTAIATLFLVLEMRKQRVGTYSPHLFFEISKFYVQGMHLDNIAMASIWRAKKENSDTFKKFDQTSTHYNRFFIQCNNLGFGSAKNVSVKFSYDVDEFVNLITKLEKNVNQDLQIEIINKDNFITFVPSKILPYKGFGASPKIGNEYYAGHIPPFNVNQVYVPIGLPLIYLELINVYVFYKSNTSLFTIYNNEIPDLEMKISYKDIKNKKIEKKFKLSANITLFGTISYYGEFIATEE